MVLRLLIVCGLALTSACSGDSESCLIEDVIVAIADDGAEDCGVITASAEDATFTTAHDCVAGAIIAGTPFQVQWDLQGIDSRVSRALIGTAAGAGIQYRLLSFDGDPGGGGGSGNPHTATHLCANLLDEGQCADMRTSLCFECVNSSLSAECPKPASSPGYQY